MPSYYPEPPHADDLFPRTPGPNKAWRQAVKAHQDWLGNELWTAHHKDRLDLGNPNAVAQFLATRGVGPERGGGLHTYRMFMGDLPTEGFGMGFRGIPHAMEATMPDWARFRDYTIQAGNPRGVTDQMYFPWSPWNAPQPAPTATGLPGASASAAAPMAAPMMGMDEEDDDEKMWGGY